MKKTTLVLGILATAFFPARSGAQEATATTEPRLTWHRAPQPLSEAATTSDWPRFLGPADNAISPETHLLETLPAEGPPLLWELQKGEGYASPVIAQEKLLLFHRLDGEETLECRHPETGAPLWQHAYPIDYRDRYGYSNGPRGSAVIAGQQVFTFGVTGWLKAFDLDSGQVLWEKSLAKEFTLRPAFFGAGHSVLVRDGKVFLNLGADGGPCVAAFDAKTGDVVWGAEQEWGASYASPVANEAGLYVFAGGESKPPHGGLLWLDPDKGEILGRFPWRAESYESVNATTPIILPNGDLFITQCYNNGSALLRPTAGEGLVPVWTNPKVGAHWSTPIAKDGHLFVISGRHQQNAELVCVDATDGTEKWAESLNWKDTIEGREVNVGVQRGALLEVDGRTLCLGEMGSLAWLEMTPKGVEITSRCQLFLAPQTWSLPALSRGLLYIMQHDRDYASQSPPRMLCYDLRGS